MIKIDLEGSKVTVEDQGQAVVYDLSSPQAFEVISQAWLRSGWDVKYVYSFAWLGRPIIQLPDDLLRIQEVIYSVQPEVIIETGVAHGGSLVFYATLCKAMGKGRVIGVDVEIRPHNRRAIESHFLFPFITLIEGSSIDPEIVSQVKQSVKPGETAIVMLDSCHTKSHVLSELEAYSALVLPGSYIVAMDGIMEQLPGAPRTQSDWRWNNPRQAALEFAASHPEFVIEEPPFPFNEGAVSRRVTYWPDAYLKRR